MGEFGHDQPGVPEIYPPKILRERFTAMLEACSGKKDGNAFANEFGAKATKEFLGESGERMLEALRTIPEGTIPEIVEQSLPIFQAWIAERFGSAKALEEAARADKEARRAAGEREDVQINDLINYTLYTDRDGRRALALHIEIAGTTLMEQPLALVGQFRAGMKDIALRLKSDASLADIALVVGHSPLVMRFAPALERMGFTLDRNDDGTLALKGDLVKAGSMKMEREEFLKRFGE